MHLLWIKWINEMIYLTALSIIHKTGLGFFPLAHVLSDMNNGGIISILAGRTLLHLTIWRLKEPAIKANGFGR
jgi:hypothetical protein